MAKSELVDPNPGVLFFFISKLEISMENFRFNF